MTQRNVADILGPLGITVIILSGISVLPAWAALIGLMSLLLGIGLLLGEYD